MPLYSSTLCARTSAGEAELSTPSQGLSLGQRRVLTLIQNPIAVDELAQQHRLEPEKLARDLTRLADLRLVVLQGTSLPSTPAPAPVGPASQSDAAAMAPIIIGRGTRRAFAMPLVAGTAALLLAAGIWYGTRTVPAPTEASKTTPAPTAAAAAPVALAPVPMPPASNAANAVAVETSSPTPVAAPVAVPRQDTTPAGVRPPLRAETPGLVPATEKVALAPDASAPKAARQSDAAGIAATSAPLAAPPVITATAAPAPAAASSPSPTPAAAAEAPPPILLASAATTLAAPRPAATTAPKALSREPPDFPKEAIADGYKSGVVTARLHVDARGSVTGVDIMGSQPPKVFDRAVRRALLRWQFEPNATGQAADLDVDVKFQRD